ncbi:MAG: LamG-like jellyroll fold domain-containing protein, partial [Verrucomicrobiota bacterium]
MRHTLFSFCVFASAFFHTAHAERFIEEFDEGDITDRWVVQKNAVGTTEISQEDGFGITVATTTNANGGLASLATFDPIAENIRVKFVVEDVSANPNANGFFVGVIEDNQVFHRTANNFGIGMFGQEARTMSAAGFGLVAGERNASNAADFLLDDGDCSLESFQDGFTVTITADTAGWAYELEGLQDPDGNDTVFANTGTWAEAGTSFEDLFGEDREWHVVTSCQSPGEIITRFDRIELGPAKEASDPEIVVPGKLNLGQLPSFPTTSEGSVTVRNTGANETLFVQNVMVEGRDADHFTITGFIEDVPPGATGEILFTLDSKGETGGFEAAFVVESNDLVPAGDEAMRIDVSASVLNLNGPVAHFTLDEEAGDTEMSDITGFGTHGTHESTVTTGVDGLAGGTAAAYAGGSFSSVRGNAFEPGTFDSFSVSLWFNAASTSDNRTLFGKGDIGASPEFALLVGSGELAWFSGDEGGFNSAVGPAVNPNQAHHVVLTFSQAVATIYLDGESIVTEANPTPLATDRANPFYIGSYAGNLPFEGTIDDVQIYNKVLTSEEVLFLKDNPGSPLGVEAAIDSDGDGLSDEDEATIHNTDPLLADTDGDG